MCTVRSSIPGPGPEYRDQLPQDLQTKLVKEYRLSSRHHTSARAATQVQKPDYFFFKCSINAFSGAWSRSQDKIYSQKKSLDFPNSPQNSNSEDLLQLVNPVFLWKGQNSFQRIFPPYCQHLTTPQISFEFSGFSYTSNSFLIKTNQHKRSENLLFSRNLVVAERKRRGQGGVIWT